jgi:hypothetical protein
MGEGGLEEFRVANDAKIVTSGPYSVSKGNVDKL